ncbi:hypothetical protein B296_00007579 [Ensete ventricosum]|uniref:Uncharacterized protein n=1 Tax=Ensete ventricosum TaxID=4639 RepID=A0A427BBF1_ENSVE|nr:hypothetical protein B296_00007579 [Ensete ventricosum]
MPMASLPVVSLLFLGCIRLLILHSAKNERSFEAHAPYLKDAFDGGTKVTQLAEVKLELEGLNTGQENTKVNNMTARRVMDSTIECNGTAEANLPCVHRMKALVISIWGLRMIRATGELDCSSAYIRLREPNKSEDKTERICRSRRKGRRCEATYSSAMGLAAPWYRRGETFMESSISCSHGGRALVVKGAGEVENEEANSNYQDKAEGKKPRNFIRLVSTGFSTK